MIIIDIIELQHATTTAFCIMHMQISNVIEHEDATGCMALSVLQAGYVLT